MLTREVRMVYVAEWLRSLTSDHNPITSCRFRILYGDGFTFRLGKSVLAFTPVSLVVHVDMPLYSGFIELCTS